MTTECPTESTMYFPIGRSLVSLLLCLFTVITCTTLLQAETQVVSNTKVSDEALHSCGVQALQIAMSLAGHSVDISKCAELAGIDPNGATTLANLQSAAKALGQTTRGMQLSPEELAFIGCPAVLHVSLPGAKSHFLVFESSDKGCFELIDSARNGQKNLYTADQLRLMWKGNCIVFTETPFLVLPHDIGRALLYL